MNNNQKGIILISVLLFLFILTLLMATTPELHLLENKMSKNNFDRIVAFEAAESGLMAWLLNTNTVKTIFAIFREGYC